MLKSKLTAKAQTTLPTGVRKALDLHAGDHVGYVLRGDFAIIKKVGREEDEADPALGAFLDMLERDISTHPERIRGVPASLVRRARLLVGRAAVDPDTPIVGPVAL